MKAALLTVISVLAVTTPVLADDSSANKPTDQITESISEKPLTPDQRKQLNAAAVRVLNKIADTRFAIRMKNFTVAKRDVDQADSALSSVKDLSPTATVREKVDLARKHLEYQTGTKVLQDLAPVTADIDRITEYVAAAQAKNHLSEAKKHLSKGDKKRARQELKLVDDALVYRELDLPITETQAQLNKARSNLDADHPGLADEALRVAENSMPVFESVFVDEPAQQEKQPVPSSDTKSKRE